MLLRTIFFVNCPVIPEIEFISINNEAEATICFADPALIKKSIGLKKIPPPIPTTPERKPNAPPTEIEIGIEILL